MVDLANELSKSNEVYIVTFRPGKSDFYRPQISSGVHQICYSGGYSVLSKVCQLFVVAYYLMRIRPDIVHAHMVAFSYIILPSFFLRKARYFYTVHNVADKDTNHGFVAKLRKFFLRKRVKGITISKFCAQSFKDFYGYDSYMTIENGCRELIISDCLSETRKEIMSLKHSSNSKIFICVARIMEQKNHILMVHAFNELAREGLDFELLLIGKYDEDSQIKQDLDKAIECDRIHFLGTRTNIPDYLSLCDYFCLSSLYEGLPISILEAGFSGCYPICTPVGGVPDVIVSDDWGMLSKDVTIESFKEAIETALKKDIEAGKMKKLYESRFSMKQCAQRYMKAYLQ